MNELLSYVFSPLREGDIALYRGSGNGLAPILLVAAEETSLGCVEERSFLERSFLRLCHYLMDLKEVLATNLRRERHAQKLTQEELAERAGLSPRYLGSIERAAVSASVTVLGHLARALSVSPCDLIHQPQRKKRTG